MQNGVSWERGAMRDAKFREPSIVKTFRLGTLPPVVSPQRARAKREKQRYRGSRQSRGYDADWEKSRNAYMKKVGGICEECLRRGYVCEATDVDHVIPISERPDLRLDPENFDALCRDHHNGWKRRLEAYAKKNHLVDMLPQWVKFPDSRPVRFQIKRYGPLGKHEGKQTSDGEIS